MSASLKPRARLNKSLTGEQVFGQCGEHMFGRILLVGLVATFLAWSFLTHASDGAGRARAYVVRPGDTLWSIAAARYAGDPRKGVWKVQRRNGLAGTTITPGERLVLP